MGAPVSQVGTFPPGCADGGQGRTSVSDKQSSGNNRYQDSWWCSEPGADSP